MSYTTFIDGTDYDWKVAIPKEEFDELVNKANDLASEFIVPLSNTVVFKERGTKINITVDVYNHKRSIDGLNDVIELLENNEIQELLIDLKDLLNMEQPKHEWGAIPLKLILFCNLKGIITTPKLIRKYYTVLYNTLNRLYSAKTQKQCINEETFETCLPIPKRESYYFSKAEKAYIKSKESEE